MNANGQPIPRFALTRADAAAALGMSLDSFKRYVQPEIRLIRRNGVRGLRVVPVSELERWVAENAEAPMIEEVGG